MIVKQIMIGLLRVCLAIVIGSIVGAVVFAGIDWMRTFQSDTIASSVARAALMEDPYTQPTSLPALYMVSKFVDWYSTVFFGYSRFGAGLAMLVATFWAMGRALPYHFVARGVIGFFAGFFIGTRVAMFVMSRPELVLVTAVYSAALCAYCLVILGQASKFHALPKLQMKHQS